MSARDGAVSITDKFGCSCIAGIDNPRCQIHGESDEWDDSPYAQYVGVGVDETPEGEVVQPVDRLKLSYRLSYWFWLNFYRLKRRLRL